MLKRLEVALQRWSGLALVVLAGALFAAATLAQAEKRVALVIGNSAYQHERARLLKSSRRSAAPTAVASLGGLGSGAAQYRRAPNARSGDGLGGRSQR